MENTEMLILRNKIDHNATPIYAGIPYPIGAGKTRVVPKEAGRLFLGQSPNIFEEVKPDIFVPDNPILPGPDQDEVPVLSTKKRGRPKKNEKVIL